MSTQPLSQNLLLAVPLAPLAGAVLAGFFGKVIGRTGAHIVTILGVLVAFVLSALTFKAVVFDGAPHFNATIYEWMNLGALKMEVGFLVDGLSAMMMCVVTFVSLMVHIYTIGYMKEDAGYQRFFSGHEQQHAAAVFWLGSGGFGVLFADWFLVHQTHGHVCQHESLFGQPGG
jgi:NADH-quinone oxidoreductase subunit L